MNTAGIRLAQLRNEKKMSQRELAEKMDVSQSYVGQWESGKRVIPTEKLLDLANFFNVSIDYLLGYTNNKTPRSKDLKDLLKEESMTYGGREISEDDLYTISKVVGALLDKKGIDR